MTDDEPEAEHQDDGIDLARSIARGLAGKTPMKRRTGIGDGKRRRTHTTSTGAHPDDRDPQALDQSMGRFVTDQGWETELRVHGVFARWEGIVGHEVGQHVTPQSYADGRLTVRTDSTAWATQMKLLAATVVRRLNEELGEGTVQVIDIVGPNTPSWNRGRFRVKGRGPRDTYG
jgi:predicted nucleic acid-binding Zn ribbon protein